MNLCACICALVDSIYKAFCKVQPKWLDRKYVQGIMQRDKIIIVNSSRRCLNVDQVLQQIARLRSCQPLYVVVQSVSIVMLYWFAA